MAKKKKMNKKQIQWKIELETKSLLQKFGERERGIDFYHFRLSLGMKPEGNGDGRGTPALWE